MARGTKKPALATGQPYGARAQQEAIPIPGDNQPVQPQQAQPQAPPMMAPPAGDVFAPSDRPHEPVTAGVGFGPGPGPNRPILPEDPDEIIRVMAEVTGHPAILDLLTEAF